GTLEDKGRLYPSHFGNPTNVFTITDASLNEDESNILFMTYFQGAEMSWTDLVSQMKDKDATIYLPYGSFATVWGAQSEAVTYLSPENRVVWTYESPDTDV